MPSPQDTRVLPLSTQGISHMQARDGSQAALIGELVAVVGSFERLCCIVEDQAKCQRERAALDWITAGEDGSFGIAVKSDSAALRWQELEKERNALIAASRAVLSKAKEI